jgi:hypothetical protein
MEEELCRSSRSQHELSLPSHHAVMRYAEYSEIKQFTSGETRGTCHAAWVRVTQTMDSGGAHSSVAKDYTGRKTADP